MKKFGLLGFFLIILMNMSIAQSNMPDFQVQTLDGKNLSILEVAKKNKLTVVSFWATWCVPCQKELDAVHKEYANWQSKYGVQIVALSIDNEKAFPKVKPLIEKKGWQYETLWDKNEAYKSKLQISSIPYTLLIDPKGKILYRHNGYKAGDEKELEEKIASFSKVKSKKTK
jgi:peroxiredoxin